VEPGKSGRYLKVVVRIYEGRPPLDKLDYVWNIDVGLDARGGRASDTTELPPPFLESHLAAASARRSQCRWQDLNLGGFPGLVWMGLGPVVKVQHEFVELYEREHERVFQVTFALCRDRDVAEDATQEAFARALERWPRLWDRPWVGGWVMSTALNAARRMLRRRPHGLSVPPINPDSESATELWEVVRRLPRRQREAVVLRYVVDLNLSEIAAAMGCREGTVKAHLSSARQSLRGWLEGARDDG
jgi:RNA polymerase sigma-70 factor (ECF subfamily)